MGPEEEERIKQLLPHARARLDLAGQKLGDRGVVALLRLIRQPGCADALEHLDLARNRIGEGGGVAIGEWLAAAAAPPASRLIHIDLSDNLLGDAAAVEFAEALRSDRSVLRHLSLQHNLIGRRGALALAGALRENQTLMTLDLRYNVVREEEVMREFGALRGARNKAQPAKGLCSDDCHLGAKAQIVESSTTANSFSSHTLLVLRDAMTPRRDESHAADERLAASHWCGCEVAAHHLSEGRMCSGARPVRELGAANGLFPSHGSRNHLPVLTTHVPSGGTASHADDTLTWPSREPSMDTRSTCALGREQGLCVVHARGTDTGADFISPSQQPGTDPPVNSQIDTSRSQTDARSQLAYGWRRERAAADDNAAVHASASSKPSVDSGHLGTHDSCQRLVTLPSQAFSAPRSKGVEDFCTHAKAWAEAASAIDRAEVLTSRARCVLGSHGAEPAIPTPLSNMESQESAVIQPVSHGERAPPRMPTSLDVLHLQAAGRPADPRCAPSAGDVAKHMEHYDKQADHHIWPPERPEEVRYPLGHLGLLDATHLPSSDEAHEATSARGDRIDEMLDSIEGDMLALQLQQVSDELFDLLHGGRPIDKENGSSGCDRLGQQAQALVMYGSSQSERATLSQLSSTASASTPGIGPEDFVSPGVAALVTQACVDSAEVCRLTRKLETLVEDAGMREAQLSSLQQAIAHVVSEARREKARADNAQGELADARRELRRSAGLARSRQAEVAALCSSLAEAEIEMADTTANEVQLRKKVTALSDDCHRLSEMALRSQIAQKDAEERAAAAERQIDAAVTREVEAARRCTQEHAQAEILAAELKATHRALGSSRLHDVMGACEQPVQGDEHLSTAATLRTEMALRDAEVRTAAADCQRDAPVAREVESARLRGQEFARAEALTAEPEAMHRELRSSSERLESHVAEGAKQSASAHERILPEEPSHTKIASEGAGEYARVVERKRDVAIVESAHLRRKERAHAEALGAELETTRHQSGISFRPDKMGAANEGASNAFSPMKGDEGALDASQSVKGDESSSAATALHTDVVRRGAKGSATAAEYQRDADVAREAGATRLSSQGLARAEALNAQLEATCRSAEEPAGAAEHQRDAAVIREAEIAHLRCHELGRANALTAELKATRRELRISRESLETYAAEKISQSARAVESASQSSSADVQALKEAALRAEIARKEALERATAAERQRDAALAREAETERLRCQERAQAEALAEELYASRQAMIASQQGNRANLSRGHSIADQAIATGECNLALVLSTASSCGEYGSCCAVDCVRSPRSPGVAVTSTRIEDSTKEMDSSARQASSRPTPHDGPSDGLGGSRPPSHHPLQPLSKNEVWRRDSFCTENLDPVLIKNEVCRGSPSQVKLAQQIRATSEIFPASTLHDEISDLERQLDASEVRYAGALLSVCIMHGYTRAVGEAFRLWEAHLTKKPVSPPVSSTPIDVAGNAQIVGATGGLDSYTGRAGSQRAMAKSIGVGATTRPNAGERRTERIRGLGRTCFWPSPLGGGSLSRAIARWKLFVADDGRQHLLGEARRLRAERNAAMTREGLLKKSLTSIKEEREWLSKELERVQVEAESRRGTVNREHPREVAKIDEAMSRVRVAEAALSDLRAQHAAALEKVRAERQDSATWRQERTALNRQLAELRKAKAEAAASEAAAWDRAHAAEGEAKRCKAEREIALREVRRTSSDAAEMNKKEAQIRGREARLISKLDARWILASIVVRTRGYGISTALARWARTTWVLRHAALEREVSRLRSIELDVGKKRRENAVLAEALKKEKAGHESALERLRTERKLTAAMRAERDEAMRAAAAAKTAAEQATKAAAQKVVEMAEAVKTARRDPAQRSANRLLNAESTPTISKEHAEQDLEQLHHLTAQGRASALAEVRELEHELGALQGVLDSPQRASSNEPSIVLPVIMKVE